MAIQWVLKLFRQGLHLESFSQELSLQVVDFLSQVWNLRGLRLDNSQFTLVISNLELKESNILKSLLILDFTSSQSVLKNLDLFVKESQLIVSSDELSTKNISLVDNVLVVLLDLLNFFIRELDDGSEFLNLSVLLNSDLVSSIVFLLPNLRFSNDLISELHLFSHICMLNRQSLIFGLDFILQLRNLMGCNLELSLQLSDLILSLNQVL